MSNYHHLSQQERYTITALLRSNNSQADISRELNRSPSTISRELRRNRSNHDHAYRAEVAHRYATARLRRVRRGSHFTSYQFKVVADFIKDKWSPEQIADQLPLSSSFSMSHETIYQYILKDKKMGGTLFTNLRIMPKIRRKRYNSRDSRGILPGKRPISTRPPEVETRQQIGHWEADTVMGKDKHHGILTLVERKSGFSIIKKVTSRTAPAVTEALRNAIAEYPDEFITITFDNGTEFHGYKNLEYEFPVTCYFATPYHAWERGSNENLNGLIRQYLPKGSSMKFISQSYCDYVAFKLNTRPRKRLKFKTPLEVFHGF